MNPSSSCGILSCIITMQSSNILGELICFYLMQAKSAASVQDKWLLVNLQSNTEFSSHMVAFFVGSIYFRFIVIFFYFRHVLTFGVYMSILCEA